MKVKKVKKPVKLTATRLKALEKKEIKKLTGEVKSLCSQACRILWGDKCAVCGKEATAAHHFFGWKACSNVRFNLDNLVWLCYHDHIGKVHQQGLTEPVREALIKRIGIERFEALKSEAFKIKKYSVEDLESIRIEIQEVIKELRDDS